MHKFYEKNQKKNMRKGEKVKTSEEKRRKKKVRRKSKILRTTGIPVYIQYIFTLALGYLKKIIKQIPKYTKNRKINK